MADAGYPAAPRERKSSVHQHRRPISALLHRTRAAAATPRSFHPCPTAHRAMSGPFGAVEKPRRPARRSFTGWPARSGRKWTTCCPFSRQVLLGFLESIEGDVVLTELGRTFVTATHPRRKVIVSERA